MFLTVILKGFVFLARKNRKTLANIKRKVDKKGGHKAVSRAHPGNVGVPVWRAFTFLEENGENDDAGVPISGNANTRIFPIHGNVLRNEEDSNNFFSPLLFLPDRKIFILSAQNQLGNLRHDAAKNGRKKEKVLLPET